MATRSKTLLLTIVRHGQTNANKERLMQGWADIPLNDIGVKQAQAAGKALKQIEFHHAFSSDLQRAFKTCQLILEENQRSTIFGEDVKKDKLLRERNFGVFEGKSYDLVAEFREKYGEYHPIENGESGVDVENRIHEFLQSLLELDNTDENVQSILIVSHGGFITKMLSVMFNEMACTLSPNIKNVPDFKGGYNAVRPANTCFSRFEMDLCVEKHTIKTIKCLELLNADHLNNLS